MKCPKCGNWVKEFAVTQEVTEHGGIDFEGDMDFDDSDCDSFKIYCPACGEEVFDSDPFELQKYYSQE